MTKIIKNARLITKNTSEVNATPTIPNSNDHTTGQWTKYDLYVSELYLNSVDDKLWIRTNNSIREIILNDGTGDYNIFPIFHNKNILTKSLMYQDNNNVKVSGNMDISGSYLINGISITSSLTGSSFLQYTEPFTQNYIPVITSSKKITNSSALFNNDGLTVNNYINTTNGYKINGVSLSLNDLIDLYSFTNGLNRDVNNNVSLGGTLFNNINIDSNTNESLYIGSFNPLNEIGLYSNTNLYLENNNVYIDLATNITLDNKTTSIILKDTGLEYNIDLSSFNQFNNRWIPDKLYVDTKINNNAYYLSAATSTILGGVIIGDNINVAIDGTISLDIASALTSGVLTNTEWNRINNHINDNTIHFTIESLNLLQYSLTGHSHFINEINNLQIELDNRSLTGHTHTDYSMTGHTHISTDITDLNDILINYSITGHSHFINDINNLQLELDNRSLTGHSHFINDINNLQLELDNRSLTGHSHTEFTNIHIQNTDTGTTNQSFSINNQILLKNNSGSLELRNFTDTDYANLSLKNLNLNSLTGITERIVSVDNSGILKIYTGITSSNNSTQILTSSSSITWNISSGNIALLTLNNTNITLNIINAISGETGIIIITQGSGGYKTITTWPTTSKFMGGTNTLTTISGAIDILSYLYINGVYYWNLGGGYI
jgi:hypothetical protein